MRHQLSTTQNASGSGGASRQRSGRWLPRRMSRVSHTSPRRTAKRRVAGSPATGRRSMRNSNRSVTGSRTGVGMRWRRPGRRQCRGCLPSWQSGRTQGALWTLPEGRGSRGTGRFRGSSHEPRRSTRRRLRSRGHARCVRSGRRGECVHLLARAMAAEGNRRTYLGSFGGLRDRDGSPKGPRPVLRGSVQHDSPARQRSPRSPGPTLDHRIDALRALLGRLLAR